MSRLTFEGFPSERQRDRTITGWYVDEHGGPPIPEPLTPEEKLGHSLLCQPDFWAAIDSEDELPGEPTA